jgi:stage V sporulation protein AE
MEKRKVILVTDGDAVARSAVELATSNIGGRCITASWGNPTVLSGEEIVNLIKTAPHDPVVVMVDDRGTKGKGEGELAMETILNDESIDVLGVVAVSSKGKDCKGIPISCSITKEGKVIENGVDKYGNNIEDAKICGDTLSILKDIKDMVIVGIGDPGKMDSMDEITKGSPITTMALQEILRRKHMLH